MKIKHNIGRKNDKLISGIPKNFMSFIAYPPISIIIACNFGIKAPPTIAIINPADPILLSSTFKLFRSY